MLNNPSAKQRQKIFTALLCLCACSAPLLLTGCEGVLNPAGPIADANRLIILDALAIMLAIVIPTIIAIIAFAWWFRASNTRAKHLHDWSYSGRLELLVWSIPALVVLFLGGIAWYGAHDLDPAKPIESHVKPLEIEVVSMDWKWLFIYPNEGMASINSLVVPVGVPLHLRITSATVMNVFFVPQIGSEIYTMNAMVTQINLQADKAGTYPGLSAHFSGDGFSGMAFDMKAVPQAAFNSWVSNAHTQGAALDDAAYKELLKQTHDIKPYTYRTVRAGLFDDIVSQKLPPGEGPNDEPSPKTFPKGEQ